MLHFCDAVLEAEGWEEGEVGGIIYKAFWFQIIQ